MADDVLKAFVISLGWKIDQGSEKKFHNVVRSATTQALLLADAVESMSKAVARHVNAVVQSFDHLSYASARTSTSVDKLKGLQYGFTQVGGSAQQAVSAVDSFMRAMRMNPGLSRFVKDLGVDQAKEGAEQFLDVIERLGKLPRYIGARQAEMLGIDEQTFDMAVRNLPLLRSAQASNLAFAKAIGRDGTKAAQSATDLSRELGRLAGSATVVSERFVADLMPPLTGFVRLLNEWVEKHADDIRRVMDSVKEGIDKLANGFSDLLVAAAPIAEAFQSIAESLTGEKGLKASLELIADVVIVGWVTKILAAITRVRGAWLGLLSLFGLAKFAGDQGVLAFPQRQGMGGWLESLDPGLADRALGPVQGGRGEKREGPGLLRRMYEGAKRVFGAGGSDPGAGEETAPGRFSALKALIQSRESGSHSYNSVYGNGKYGWPEKKITEMTVREALDWQRQQKAKYGTPAFPVGRGQFVGRTLDGLAREFNAYDQKMSPELQEKFMDALIRRRGRSPSALRAEWEGLNGVSDAAILGAYDKDGTVKALPGGGRSTPIPKLNFHPSISMDQFNDRFGGPLPMGSVNNSSAMDNRSYKVEHKTDVHISGASDPSATASRVKETLDKGTSLSLRNIQSPSR